MKNFLLLTAMTVTFAINAQCPTGELNFTTQAQVDNFIIQYPNCTEVDGDIGISGNNITNLEGLSNLVSISGALEIRNTGNLASLNGLENLVSVGTDLIIRSNASLTDIEGLSSLTTVGGEFTVRSCAALLSLHGIENLESVGLALIIRDCGLLTNLDALSGVTFVGETLEIVGNALLVSVSGLSNVATIVGGEEGAVVIEENEILATLEGFGNADTTITGGLFIGLNNLLAFCSVPSICNYLDNPPAGASVDIGLNITGCNSVAEVQAACGVMSAEYFDAGRIAFRVLQNPVQETLAIHNAIAGEGTIEVYDAMSKKVLSGKMKNGLNYYTLNAGPGIYFVKMECDGKTDFAKIVKQ
ncbi:T9SS type A sorting domain-containing protein [Flavobacterium sp. MFBS3-15]|uniref:T9SS type A sorting domain-containing protein n=1 Tax=Flavobacterium sp. MFBS3-15 TaxID=2989816 RepID=UPI002235D072|nr:T9SS type A sorting domain-containing protein [Flavobacterium sp. MFBS3-15]MCW4470882.1 T9SS type A sorting domain-containing protein [Flavobacterium sp. MFBS3-15]